MGSFQARADQGATDGRAAARRRGLLLAAAVIVPAALLLLGPRWAWPLFAVPLALAFPIAGPAGLLGAITGASLACALASGRPATDGTSMGVGVLAFAAAGVAVGAGHKVQERTVTRLAEGSLVDRLTGVHNYALFADVLPRECRRAERYGVPLSLVVLDLDRFKAFNDRYGHEAGNRLLAEVGGTIRAHTRASDVAARFGGEEFALIVPGPAGEALEAAERIRGAVGRLRIPVAGGDIVGTTLSGGVAEFGGGPDGDRVLLEQADRALYEAKASGRNRVCLAAREPRWAAAS